ncbi:MAG TPA: hypothetical protein VMT35_13530 [Ignavibacteriaceae bacterium]|nr:hypothetical protein [Ignavibacteriaceae bacterium]
MKLSGFRRTFFDKRDIFSIQRFTLIGSTIFLGKLVLILIAYFFDESSYNLFNKAYYTASILILFGSFGFDFAVNRVNISPVFLSLSVFLNLSIAGTILHLLSRPFSSPFQIISVFLYSLFSCISGIYVFRQLFTGKYIDYTKLALAFAVFHLLIIPAVLILKVNIFLALAGSSLLWFLSCYPFIAKEKNEGKNLIDLYKVGGAAFIINSAVPFALVADKYIVNHYFPVSTANAYTFAWGLTVPLFYIGNLIERMIYSSENMNPEKMLKKSLLLLFSFIMVYVLAMIAAVIFFPGLLPSSVNEQLLKNIFLFMVAGYSLYALFHFPLNGYLFKFIQVDKQKRIAVIYFIYLIILVAVIISAGAMEIKDYKILLAAIWGVIFTLLGIKTLVIFGWRKAHNEHESVIINR